MISYLIFIAIFVFIVSFLVKKIGDLYLAKHVLFLCVSSAATCFIIAAIDFFDLLEIQNSETVMKLIANHVDWLASFTIYVVAGAVFVGLALAVWIKRLSTHHIK